ncbi:MAG: D-aminoacyl-tRNA deacylase [Pseudomonadales bacterium]
MRALLQRVCEASVSVDHRQIARIDHGLLVLLGIYPDDGASEIRYLVDKTLGLRIFPDSDKHMNRSVVDVAGGVLVVSQFTLAADVSRGNRPGFSKAATPEVAQPLYEDFLAVMRERYARVAAGCFGADMQVALVNDGPVTILLERHRSQASHST